jgi:hypothetical protein
LQPSSPGCTWNATAVRCASDSQFVSIVNSLRAAFPRPRYTVTAALWSTGAYGQGRWLTAKPQGAYTGSAVNMLRRVGSKLDAVNIMAYGEQALCFAE